MAQVNRRILEWIYFLLILKANCANRFGWYCHPAAVAFILCVYGCLASLQILLTTVLLSWGYVIYATRLAAQWQLKDDYPTQTHNF